MNTSFLGPAVATVLTVYGIETINATLNLIREIKAVATVLTVYGIETDTFKSSITIKDGLGCNSTYRLRY